MAGVVKVFLCPRCRTRFETRVPMIEDRAPCKCGAIAHLVFLAPKFSKLRETEGRGAND